MAQANEIESFYCCLNGAERTILRQTCEGLVLTLFVGIPLAVWDAFWFATLHNEDRYKQAFLALYGLQIVTIGDGGEAYEAVQPRTGYLARWVSWSLFVVTPGAACLEGCGQSRVP